MLERILFSSQLWFVAGLGLPELDSVWIETSTSELFGVWAQIWGTGLREALLLWLRYWDTVLGWEPGSVPQVYQCLVTLTEDWGLAHNNHCVTDLVSICLRVCWVHGL